MSASSLLVSDYPAHRVADVVLRDGATLHLRPVRPEDRPALVAFFEGLSEAARQFRFFGGVSPDRAADWASDVDYVERFGLIAVTGEADAIVGHGVYVTTAPGEAEVGFAIADAYQGRGVGTILLAHLAEAASANGLVAFHAYILLENRQMIGVFRDSGLPVTTRAEPGMLRVECPTAITPAALERYEERERTATVAALANILSPRSVAVVGASRRRGSIGGEVFHNLVSGGFNGPVYPVNPNAEVIQSVVAYPSVGAIPGPVDLAVIVVPSTGVAEVARDCATAGVKGLVVISSGFAETGEEGMVRQRELVSICRASGMRLIGPNCMGVLNTAADVGMNATFAPMVPPPGRVGFMSQSGALGLAVMDRASMLGLGISSFVSVGNKADISGNDLIQYWEADEDTDLILLYLESFGNPRRFSRLSRRIARTKPIIAVKSGRSTAGARATSSHTGALIAASDVTVDALFHQSGVIRTDTLAELFDVAALLANQPVPNGPRVGILTNAGGLGILCADACEAYGLDVPTLSDELRGQLSAFLPPEAAVTNPVDMIASASAEDYARAVRLLAQSGEVDSLVAIFIPPLVTRAEDVAIALREAAGGIGRMVALLTVFASAAGPPPELGDLASLAFPEDAARAIGRAVRYREWLDRPDGVTPSFEVDADEAAAIVAAALARGSGWLGADETWGLLRAYGLPVVESRTVRDPAAAAVVAAEIGGPVALKAVAAGLVHKTEAGAVRLGVSADDVAAAAGRMARDVEAAGHSVEGFIVQPMIDGGHELLVGVVHDPSFGPVVACGAGGVTAELLKDVAVGLAPLTDVDAGGMVRSLKVLPLLEGYRGGPKGDLAALEEVLLRVSRLVEAHPEIAEMDLNPVKLLPDRAVVVDARIRIEATAPPPPLLARRPA